MLATAILCGLLLIFPLAHITDIAPPDNVTVVGQAPDGAIYNVWGLEYASGQSDSFIYHGILTVLSTLLPLITLFLYRNRRLQLSLCFFEGVMVVGLLAFNLIGFFKLQSALSVDPRYLIDHSIVIFAPLFAIVATIFAYKGVLRDILLLSSSDRIR